MSKSRSVSRSAPGGTIHIDASYAQELVEFWTQKYERVKEELDQIKEASVTTSLSPRGSSYDKDDGERQSSRGSTTVTEQSPRSRTPQLRNQLAFRLSEEDSETKALRARNENLQYRLAASEQKCLALSLQIERHLAQNASLAREAGILRQEKINNIYPPVAFLPEGFGPSICWAPSARTLLDRLPGNIQTGYPFHFVSRPPASLPVWINACGLHGYWFSPTTMHLEGTEFELIVEAKPAEWTYLGRYRSVFLLGGEMQLSEWLLLDDGTKDTHCMRVASKRLGQEIETPATLDAAATEIKQQINSGQTTIPCFALVCTGFTLEVRKALQGVSTQTGKRKSTGYVQVEVGVKRIKGETDV